MIGLGWTLAIDRETGKMRITFVEGTRLSLFRGMYG